MNSIKIGEIVYYLNHMSETETTIKEEFNQGYMAGYRQAIADLFDNFRDLLNDTKQGE